MLSRRDWHGARCSSRTPAASLVASQLPRTLSLRRSWGRDVPGERGPVRGASACGAAERPTHRHVATDSPKLGVPRGPRHSAGAWQRLVTMGPASHPSPKAGTSFKGRRRQSREAGVPFGTLCCRRWSRQYGALSPAESHVSPAESHMGPGLQESRLPSLPLARREFWASCFCSSGLYGVEGLVPEGSHWTVSHR